MDLSQVATDETLPRLFPDVLMTEDGKSNKLCSNRLAKNIKAYCCPVAIENDVVYWILSRIIAFEYHHWKCCAKA